MAADPGMLRVELYVDGDPRRLLKWRDDRAIWDSADGWFRAVRPDPSLKERGPGLTVETLPKRAGVDSLGLQQMI